MTEPESAAPSPDELRQALFVRPETKEDLHDWIYQYLGIDYPGEVVDPESNSSPMDMIWEVYSKLIENDPKFSRVLYYACRDGYKTLGMSTLETVVVALLQINTAHMAAIVEQSFKAKQYVRENFGREFLRDYVSTDAQRTTVFDRAAEFGGGSNYLKIIVATMQGTNFEHVPVFSIDEVDVLPNPKAYEEAKLIQSPDTKKLRPDGAMQLPITVLTSTRKFSYGLVQNEIDGAEKSGLHVRHWNIIDVTEKCPAARHLPDEPTIEIYYDKSTFRSLSATQWASLPGDEAKKFAQGRGFSGCLKNCTLFSVCQGRLARRKETTQLLKPIDHVMNLFKHVSLELAQAQLMCWKPSATGLIYPTMSRLVHKKTAAEIAEMLTGRPREASFTKADLMPLLTEMGIDLYAGLDWGFTHNFVFLIIAVDGAGRTFVLDCLSASGLELDDAVAMSVDRANPFGGPKAIKMVYPDQAYPDHNKTLRRKGGFKVAKFKKEVSTGIEATRMKLMTATSETSLFFLAEDPGVDLLFDRMSRYHWKMDAAGNATKEPDKVDDDECDALRYPLQCLFMKDSGILTAGLSEAERRANAPVIIPGSGATQHSNWLTLAVQKAIQEQGGAGQGAGKSGNLSWDFGEGEEI